MRSEWLEKEVGKEQAENMVKLSVYIATRQNHPVPVCTKNKKGNAVGNAD
jgi:hypothetical protein